LQEMTTVRATLSGEFVPAGSASQLGRPSSFSTAASRALNHAARTADELGHPHIGTEHLLIGVLTEQPWSVLLESAGTNVSARAIRDRLARGTR